MQKHELKKRDLYLQKMIAFQDTEMIKVMTGIRRCGKSSLMKLMAEHLRETGIVDEPTIRKYVDVFKVLNPMSADEEDDVIKELHTRLAVRMDRGACLKEKDHVSWYYAAKKDITPTFWERYRTYLMKSQGFNRDVIKAQMFTKTDLAKYMNIRMCLPHVASTGGQKSFAKFAEWAASQWEKGDAGFNEMFFREVVAMAILFKQADRIVKCQPWYNSYKALRKRKTVGGKEIYAYGCAVSISFAFDGGLCVHSVWS